MSLIDITVPSESEEGTTMKVQAWLKQLGDLVIKDEPIVEMETDKVTLEIEAPADGVLSEILVHPDADVTPDMVIGRIRFESAFSEPDKSEGDLTKSQAPQLNSGVLSTAKGTVSSDGAVLNTALSPSVRRFVFQHDLDASLILGTGKNSRVTLNDAKQYLSKLVAENTSVAKGAGDNKAVEKMLSKPSGTRSYRVPHTSMRRSIAEHMSSSVRDAPHVTAIFDADFSAVAAHRQAHKQDYAKRGVKLTYTAYVLMACTEAMKVVPEINSQWHSDSIEVFSDVNIGVGTALGDKGLVVPVINEVQEKNLFAAAKALQDITDRARDNRLRPTDMRGGTFTVSNHGVSGSLLATPIIINQPQSAILGVGKLEKRVVVRELEGQDVMLIKPMAYVSLTIDHRVIDGHQTNTWLAAFVAALENWTAQD